MSARGGSARSPHLLPASLVLALTAWVLWVSWTREPAAAFLFPRLIGTVMFALAGWNFARAALGLSRVGGGVAARELLVVLPGIVVMLALVLWAAKAFGFYPAAFVAFVLLHSLHDPAPHTRWRSWARRLLVALLFMGIIYLLFTVLLKVQVPRGALPFP